MVKIYHQYLRQFKKKNLNGHVGQPSPGRIVPTWRLGAAVYHGGTKRGPVVECIRVLAVGALGTRGTVGHGGEMGG